MKLKDLMARLVDLYGRDTRYVEGTVSRLVNAKSVEMLMPEGLGHYANIEKPVENA
jgi:hypothetical protein